MSRIRVLNLTEMLQLYDLLYPHLPKSFDEQSMVGEVVGKIIGSIVELEQYTDYIKAVLLLSTYEQEELKELDSHEILDTFQAGLITNKFFVIVELLRILENAN